MINVVENFILCNIVRHRYHGAKHADLSASLRARVVRAVLFRNGLHITWIVIDKSKTPKYLGHNEAGIAAMAPLAAHLTLLICTAWSED